MTSAEPLPLSLASPSASPRLPVELLAQIVDEAAGDRDKLDFTTLRHLCLTSRNILPFARSALYRDISITFRDSREEPVSGDVDWDDVVYDPDLDEAGGVAWDRTRIIITDGAGLEATLFISPHLACLVHGITLHFLNVDFSTRWLPRHSIRVVCTACPAIQRLRVRGTDQLEIEAVEDILRRLLPPLVEYELDFLSYGTLLIHNLPVLRHLRLDRVILRDGQGEALVFPSSLTSLHLGGWGPPSVPSLPRQLESLALSLRRLKLEGSAAWKLGPHLGDFKALVSLTVGTTDTEAPSWMDTTLEAISSLTGLKSLHLDGWSVDAPHLERLSPCLHAVRFGMLLE